MGMATTGRRKMITCSAVRGERLSAISTEAQALFWRIYMIGDNYGTCIGKPFDVKAEAAPMCGTLPLAAVGAALDELVSVGLLVRWQADGETWLHVVGHDEHQSADFIRKRGKRRTPKPPETPEHMLDAAPTAAVATGRERKARLSTTTSTPTGLSSPNGDSPVSQDDDTITDVLQEWQRVWGKQRSAITGAKAKKRRSRVKARLDENWSGEQLKTAVRGWRNDSWSGRPDNCDVTQILRDSQQVEKGLELADRGGKYSGPPQRAVPDCDTCGNDRLVQAPDDPDAMIRCPDCTDGAAL